MKRQNKYVIGGLLAILLSIIAGLTFLNFDRARIIQEKDNNIATLKRIQKVTEKTASTKDSLLKLNEKMLNACNTNIKQLVKNDADKSTIMGFTFGDRDISVEELLKITNNALKENRNLKRDLKIKDFKLKTVKEKFGLSFKDTTNMIILEENSQSLLRKLEDSYKTNDSLNADLQLKKRILGLIDENYHIPYTIKSGTITIPDNKLDTLIVIYPLIKKRIKTKNGKIWVSAF